MRCIREPDPSLWGRMGSEHPSGRRAVVLAQVTYPALAKSASEVWVRVCIFDLHSRARYRSLVPHVLKAHIRKARRILMWITPSFLRPVRAHSWPTRGSCTRTRALECFTVSHTRPSESFCLWAAPLATLWAWPSPIMPWPCGTLSPGATRVCGRALICVL